MKHYLTRNYRNYPCSTCQTAAPHDERGCVVCRLKKQEARNELLLGATLAVLGYALLVALMCL